LGISQYFAQKVRLKIISTKYKYVGEIIMSGCYIILNKSKSNKDKLLVKVGCSKDIERRFKEICTSHRFNGMNDELELMQIIPVKQFLKLEKTLHSLLNAYRCKTGEWFCLTEDFLNQRLMMVGDLSRYN
jgi:hypothetical protein